MRALCFFLAFGSAAGAQRTPQIRYVYPAGGQSGTTFVAVIGGQYLVNTTNAFVSGSGVTVTGIDQEPLPRPKEVQELREQMGNIQKKRKQGERLTREEMRQAAEIREKLMVVQRKRANPALGEFVTLHIAVASNAVPGRRELRLATRTGLSNPLAFCIGQLPEVSKPDWKNTPRPGPNQEPDRPPPTESRIRLPATLNGQIPPGGVDRYRFAARAGQQLVVAVEARELIPYLADAVPGWFQATLSISDADGRELVYADDFRFQPDPVLLYEIPRDGDYVLEIKDALYRGREDFVYRLSVGELPFITSIFPRGGRANTSSTFELRGWNLPSPKVTVNLQDTALGVHSLSVRSREWISNLVPYAVNDLPEMVEAEASNPAAPPQSVTLPVIINGRIDRPDDWDIFRFEGQAGDRIVVEVTARRVGSPLDSIVKLTDAQGQVLAINDDQEDKASGRNTHHADSYLAVTLPASGPYSVHLGDTQHQGGWAYSYRLRLSAPRPDFELRVVPSSLTVRAGVSAPLTVYALRKDDYAGEIELTLKDAPEGFKLTGGRVPAKEDQAKVTLWVSPRPASTPFTLRLEGRAVIAGREVVRPAVPAEDMMQAFIYRHLVPARELQVAVIGRVARP